MYGGKWGVYGGGETVIDILTNQHINPFDIFISNF